MHDLGHERYVLKRQHRHANMSYIAMYLLRVTCGCWMSTVGLIYSLTSKSTFLFHQDVHKPMWKKNKYTLDRNRDKQSIN